MEEEKKPAQKLTSPKAPEPTKEYKVGDTYEVPPEGSLGLLALGYRGLEAWRKAQQKTGQEATLETATTENTKTAKNADE